ncbi:Six-hairpin glycosidase-like protein [Multifurca ochricompacta]|uniref:Six-hairpin glycosidase-like protein n=1 Tax=Multifurca ochricompacta TaxID=376703 RepID=A0AAD4LXY4_9AGAM|nr:Six-hairpin glycosidase-like protein [Multifurca ochricompacta]
MRPSSLFLLALAYASCTTATINFTNTTRKHLNKSLTVHAYLDSLVPVAEDVMLNQLAGPSIGADPGVIMTVLPEEGHPEYDVYWVRDACLAHYAWISELELAGSDTSLRAVVDDYARALIRTQHVVSIAGNIFTGGLEEASFDLKLGMITNPYYRPGSPAADGPPLRAMALIKYAEWLLQPEQNNGTWVADVLWPAINLDLQWISQHWNQSSYGLHRVGSLVGARVGGILLDVVHAIPCLAYGSPPQPSNRSRGGRSRIWQHGVPGSGTFWNEEQGFMTETTVTDVSTGGRSGIGSAPLTVSILNFDPTLGCDPLTFQPCSDRALSTLKVVGDAFKEAFPVNQGLPSNQSPFFGSSSKINCSEGITPFVQYFASFNVAEQIFDALITWDLLGELQVTNVSLQFFRQFDEDVVTGVYVKGSERYERLTFALNDWAENTLLALAARTPDDLILPLIMDKTTGEPAPPRGALRSQIAVLGAHNAYSGVIPPSWVNGTTLFKSPPKKSAMREQCHVRRPDASSTAAEASRLQFPVGFFF